MPLRYGQVFWLPDLSTHRAFPSRPGAIVAFSGFRPRSQRRVRDGFAPPSLEVLTDNPWPDTVLRY
jgi:hypothetical protein